MRSSRHTKKFRRHVHHFIPSLSSFFPFTLLHDTMPAIFSHALLILSTLLTLSTCQQPDPAFTMTQPFTSASNTFDTFGSASLHSDTIVLTPHSPGHLLGAIWSKNTNPYEFWEAEFTFRVQGAERGGNGLAFWYSGKRGLGGNVFGSVDSWDGLGLFFDPNSGGKVDSSLSGC